MASGIYLILNRVTGRCYIGSTTNQRCRWYNHRRTLERGVHHCQHLQRAWNKYGGEGFVFVWLVDALPCQLLALEQHLLNVTEIKYNTGKYAYAAFQGRRHTDEAKAKMRAKVKGRRLTDATKEKLRLANLGNHISEECKSKISQALTGRAISEETAKKSRGVGYWWCQRRGQWQIRIHHHKRELCHVFCDSEDNAREVVRIVRAQADSGAAVSVPPELVTHVVGPRHRNGGELLPVALI